jgi:hypothetical protein
MVAENTTMSPSMRTVALLLDSGTLTYNVVTDAIELSVSMSRTADILRSFPTNPQKV